MEKNPDRKNKPKERETNHRSGPEGHAGTPTADKAGPVLDAVQNGDETNRQLLNLQIEKIKYEIGLGRRLEIIKGALSVFTAIGVIFTVYLGITQQKQAATYRNDDRFDRSITRLSSHEASERLAGLAGIQQFLSVKDAERQRSALIYLVNAASLESDPTVRSAIEETFNRLTQQPIPKEALDAALEVARDDNTSLLRRRIDLFIQQETAAKKLLVDPHYSEVLIGDASSQENLPLQSSAKIIAALIRAGAKIPDLKGIYCVECDFTGKKIDLSGIDFEGALLRGAQFSRANLDNANFHNADLVLTNFLGASLIGANLSSDTTFVPYPIMAARAVGDMYASYGTIFACADLRKSDLSGRLLFTLIYDDPIWGGSQRDEFYRANLDGAKLANVQFGVAIPMSKFSGDSTKETVPSSLTPISNLLLGGSTEPLHYSGDDPYRIWTEAAEPVSALNVENHYKIDALFALGSIYSANGWDRALLPSSFQQILADRADEFKKSPISFDCTTGQKKADISSMFSGSQRSGNARF